MAYNQSLNSEQLHSEVISFLRFPLCVGIVLIHASVNTENCVVCPIYESVYYLFAQILARVAVPLFFLFSGFLFFNRLDRFTLSVYTEKLRKRIRTLLIPYLFWNLMTVLYYLLSRFLGGETQFGAGFTVVDWLELFWDNPASRTIPGEGIASYPICIQFWYIRDLMVVVLLSPVIYWLVRKLRFCFVAILAVLWVVDCWWLVTGLNITALFFFSLGSYCSIYKKNFVELVRTHTLLLGVSYLVMIIPMFVVEEPNWNPSRRIALLLGMAFVISVVARFVAAGKWKVNKFLSDSSFFIFAYHTLALMVVAYVTGFSFGTDVLCTMQYIFESVVVVLAGLFVYWLLRRWLPQFTAVITGGR